MRTIDITSDTVIEVWPGRRLHLPSQHILLNLPKGYMGVTGPTVSFGSGASSVHLSSTPERARRLFGHIVDMEKPSQGRRLA